MADLLICMPTLPKTRPLARVIGIEALTYSWEMTLEHMIYNFGEMNDVKRYLGVRGG